MTPLYDLTLLKTNAGGDAVFVREIITMFKDSGHDNLNILEKNCIDGPCHDWVEAAHSLKGGAAMMGAEALRKTAADAQNASDTSASERSRMYQMMHDLYTEICTALRSEGLLD